MNIRRRLFASFTVLAMLASILTMSAASAQTGSEGGVTLDPATGTTTDSFTLVADPNATTDPITPNCPGDTATDGYNWSTFIVPDTLDPATLTWSGTGPNEAGAFPLISNGNPIVNVGLAPNTGQLTGEPPAGYQLDILTSNNLIGDGDYLIGIACTLAGATATTWHSPITISNGATEYSTGAVVGVPDAPVLDSVSAGNGELTAAFTPGAANPAIDSFEATATPQGGGAAVSETGTGSPITIPGLTNGTTYDVVVTATNTEGTSAASNTLSGTPAVSGQPAVDNLVAVPGAAAGDIDVSWDAPANAGTLPPTGYTLTVDPADAGPFTLGSGVTSQSVTGLTPGTPYTFTVEATYAAPDFGTPASVQAVPASDRVLNQAITVERPAGALILTQRCGVWNGNPGFQAVNSFPGYPSSLPGITRTSDQVGTSPDADLATPGQQDDPEFGNYPFPSPATYPTQCGLDFGTAELVTSGALAGQYYTANGVLNEVTVVDTRDVDAGWTVSGTMSDFASGNDSFSGNYLGWVPKVTSDSDATGTGYDQTVTPGPTVLPGEGVSAGTGMGSAGGQVLASANAGEGLGIAVLDARLLLLIPVDANAGSYDGILALTIV